MKAFLEKNSSSNFPTFWNLKPQFRFEKDNFKYYHLIRILQHICHFYPFWKIQVFLKTKHLFFPKKIVYIFEKYFCFSRILRQIHCNLVIEKSNSRQLDIFNWQVNVKKTRASSGWFSSYERKLKTLLPKIKLINHRNWCWHNYSDLKIGTISTLFTVSAKFKLCKARRFGV